MPLKWFLRGKYSFIINIFVIYFFSKAYIRYCCDHPLTLFTKIHFWRYLPPILYMVSPLLMILSGTNFWKLRFSEGTFYFGKKWGDLLILGGAGVPPIFWVDLYEFTKICLLPDKTSCGILDQAQFVISGCTKVAFWLIDKISFPFVY